MQMKRRTAYLSSFDSVDCSEIYKWIAQEKKIKHQCVTLCLIHFFGKKKLLVIFSFNFCLHNILFIIIINKQTEEENRVKNKRTAKNDSKKNNERVAICNKQKKGE